MESQTFKVPVIQTNYAKILVEVCAEYDVDLHKLLEDSGLPADLIQSESDFVPSESIKRLLFLTSSQLGESGFVDVLRLAIRRRILPYILHQFKGYKTIGEALPNLQAIFLSDTPSSNVFFTQEFGDYWFCVKTSGKDRPHYEWSEVFAVMYIVELMGVLSNTNWQPDSVKLQGSESNLVKMLLPIHCKLFVEQEHKAVRIPEDLLSIPIHLSESSLSSSPAIIEWHASFTDNVFEVLLPYVRERDITIEFAAELLDYTVRTLQRKLAQEGTSFRKIKESLMFSVACELLEEGRSLTFIANQLGYSSLSHFSRAFKRVSGLSPKLYKASIG